MHCRDQIRPFLPRLLGDTLQRLQKVKAVRVLREFFVLVGLLAGIHGGGLVSEVFDSLQPGCVVYRGAPFRDKTEMFVAFRLMFQALPQLAPDNLNKVLGRRNRKIVQVGFTRILTEVPFVDGEKPNAW